MVYEGMVYRPPSEARSLIIQVTIGCTHNKCTFCNMFKDKRFRMRKREEIFADLDEMSLYYGHLPLRIFLADGDALALKTEYLLAILDHIREKFPVAERVTIYGRAREVNNKSVEELRQLKEAGLQMVYMGVESGHAQILEDVKKGETVEEFAEAAARLRESGILLSATFISGLGGRTLLREHAIESAKLTSLMKPDYVGFLTLLIEPGAPLYQDLREGRFELLKQEEVVEEMKLYLEHVDSEGTVFRSNHASNYIVLSGTLNQDRQRMLDVLEEARHRGRYRPEAFRGI